VGVKVGVEGKNPHFNKKPRWPLRQDPVQPMDVDSSSRFRQATQNQQSTISGRPINQIFNPTLTVAMGWHIKDPLIVARGTRDRNSKE